MKTMSGAALVITVWLIALATVLGLNYSLVSRADSKITTAALAGQKARAAAEAGIWRAVYELDSPRPANPWPTDGTGIEFEFNGVEVLIMMQNQTGLVGLNSASRATLTTIVYHITRDPLRAEQIVDAIMDWRDRDHVVRASGAEDREYRVAGFDYEAKDGPFNTREELELVMGLTRDDYRKIAPFVTVYTRARAVDAQFAPAHILNAMPELETGEPEAPNTPRGLARDPALDRIATPPEGRRAGIFEIFAQATVRGVLSRLAATVEISRPRRTGPRAAILAWRETWPMEIPLEEFDENPPAR